jgi:hypothetical protein
MFLLRTKSLYYISILNKLTECEMPRNNLTLIH